MDACAIGSSMTKTERSGYNAAVNEMRAAGATADDVHVHAAVYRVRWPEASLTPHALKKHWGDTFPRPEHLPRPKVNGNLATLARIAGTDAAH